LLFFHAKVFYSYNYSKKSEYLNRNLHLISRSLIFHDFIGCKNHATVFYEAPAEIMQIYTTLVFSCKGIYIMDRKFFSPFVISKEINWFSDRISFVKRVRLKKPDNFFSLQCNNGMTKWYFLKGANLERESRMNGRS